MKKYVLAIGELLVDAITTTTVADLSSATALEINAGGSTANFCMYLTKCQTNTLLIANIGNDGLGNILLNNLKSKGLNTDGITLTSQHATSLIVVAKTNETPDFIAYRAADRFIETINDDVINNAIIVHSTAFCLSKNPARHTVLAAFKKAHQQQIPISIDWNYSDKIWGNNNDAKNVLEIIEEYKPLMKFSIDDVERFLGKIVTIEEAKTFLQALNTTAICLTCGKDGVYYKNDTTDWAFCPAQKIEVKNATGAGDSFWAGFISAYTEKLSIDVCVEKAIDTATKKLTGELI